MKPITIPEVLINYAEKKFSETTQQEIFLVICFIIFSKVNNTLKKNFCTIDFSNTEKKKVFSNNHLKVFSSFFIEKEYLIRRKRTSQFYHITDKIKKVTKGKSVDIWVKTKPAIKMLKRFYEHCDGNKLEDKITTKDTNGVNKFIGIETSEIDALSAKAMEEFDKNDDSDKLAEEVYQSIQVELTPEDDPYVKRCYGDDELYEINKKRQELDYTTIPLQKFINCIKKCTRDYNSINRLASIDLVDFKKYLEEKYPEVYEEFDRFKQTEMKDDYKKYLIEYIKKSFKHAIKDMTVSGLELDYTTFPNTKKLITKYDNKPAIIRHCIKVDNIILDDYLNSLKKYEYTPATIIKNKGWIL